MLLFSGISPISSLKYFSPGRRGLESQVRAGKFFGRMHGDSEEISVREAHRGNVLGLYNISHEIKGNRRAKRAEKCFLQAVSQPPTRTYLQSIPVCGFFKVLPQQSPNTFPNTIVTKLSNTPPDVQTHAQAVSRHFQTFPKEFNTF
jgi:hypothetical protein